MLPNSTTRAQLPGRGQGRLIGSFITGSGRPSPLFQVPTEELQRLPSFLDLILSCSTNVQEPRLPAPSSNQQNQNQSTVHQSAVISNNQGASCGEECPEAVPCQGKRPEASQGKWEEGVGLRPSLLGELTNHGTPPQDSSSRRGRVMVVDNETGRQPSLSPIPKKEKTGSATVVPASNNQPLGVLQTIEEAPVEWRGRKDGW